MRKSILPPIAIFTSILLFIGFFVYCYISSIEIHNIIADCFVKSDPYFPNYDDKINEDIFNHFRLSCYNDVESGNKKDLSLSLIFGINNIFSDGMVFMNYSLEIRDSNGRLLSGSRNVPITIHIKRFSTGWKIVQIDEAP